MSGADLAVDAYLAELQRQRMLRLAEAARVVGEAFRGSLAPQLAEVAKTIDKVGRRIPYPVVYNQTTSDGVCHRVVKYAGGWG